MSTATIRTGHVLTGLASMPAGSARCCVTSPPYWGLRDYGTGGQPWPAVTFAPMPGLPPITIPEQVCSLGLEADPWAFVGHLVEVFRGVRRVLSEDGTCWVNLGDSYANNSPVRASASEAFSEVWSPAFNDSRRRVADSGLKMKDLVGIPWRVAFALHADGWYLRSDIIWAKPNPMPESVTDRPTKAHEYVFLLSKSGRYYFDQEAVRERSTGQGGAAASFKRETKDHIIPNQSVAQHRMDRSDRDDNGSRNLRTVWTIPTTPFPGAHFATFPEALPERCIKAGSSEKGRCPECGAAWERVRGRSCDACGGMVPTQAKSCPACNHVRDWKDGREVQPHFTANDWSTPGRGTPRLPGGFANATETTGWRPTCTHDLPPVPDTVLDPFTGAGTTGLVALRLGRSFAGCELSPEYADMARQRLSQPPEEGREEAVKAKAIEGLPLFGGAR